MRRRFLLASLAALALVAGGVSAASVSNVAGYAIDNGDANGDWRIDLCDVAYLLGHLFARGPAPVELAYCGGTPSTVKNGDFDGNRKVNMGDTVNWIKYLFTRGKKPVAACKKAGIARVAPPDGDAFGLSLAEWSEKYWQWNYRGADPAQAMIGKTMLVPMPSNGVQMSGDWTWDNPALMVGSIEITMPAGTPFVIPEFAWIAERYATYPDKADDILFSEADMLSCIDMDLTMDGTSIMTNANKAVFYVPPTALDPIVVYPETTYGSVAAVAFQGCAVVFAPLPVGTHTMHLYEPYIIDPNKLPFDLGVIYDNTWTITVTKK